MLVMYNRYHNYAAKQLYRINENDRFSVPRKYKGTRLEATVRYFCARADDREGNERLEKDCKAYHKAFTADEAARPPFAADELTKIKEMQQIREKYPREQDRIKPEQKKKRDAAWSQIEEEAKVRASKSIEDYEASTEAAELRRCESILSDHIKAAGIKTADQEAFAEDYVAAWTKLDDDLFNTARLITCGIYVQVAIHDYLRALMGFHQFDTNFTLDPRHDLDHHKVTPGLRHQVTV